MRRPSLLILLSLFAFAVSGFPSVTAGENWKEKSEYSSEFVKKIDKRIKRYRSSMQRYKSSKTKSGDALGQAVKDYLRPANHPKIVVEILNTMNIIKDGIVQSACVTALSSVKEGPPLNLLIAKGMRKGRPSTRALVIEGLAKGEIMPVFTIMCSMLADLKEPELVRAACARGLGLLKDARAVNVLIKMDKDASELVKLGVIEALCSWISENDVSPQCIASMIGDEKSWKVRSAAIQVCVKYKISWAVGYLINRLREEKGRMFGDVIAALKAITHIDRGENINAWEKWFELSEYARNGKVERKKRKDIPGNYTKLTYHGIRTHSKNVVFIIDKSSSMKEKADPKALKGDYTSKDLKFRGETRMELVKWELTRCIVKLPKSTSFNIIAFSTGVRTWKKKSIFATPSNRKSAVNWVNSLAPDGRTNTWGALLAAFGCKSFGDGRFNSNPMGDTIFLLTDGDPNEGELDDPDEILAGVKELNRYNKLTIHCIAVGRFNKNFCQRLAEENNGEFMDLGD